MHADFPAAAVKLRSCQRILIVGSAGAGKSTLARSLGGLLKLPVIHIDQEYWRPGWIETPADEWAAKVDELVARPQWVMDGNYSGTFEARLRRADAVLFLDFPRGLCLRRVVLRMLRNFGRTRQDMPPGCPEKIDLEFLQWIWNYPRRSRPRIRALLGDYDEGRLVLQLTKQAEVNVLIATLSDTEPR